MVKLMVRRSIFPRRTIAALYAEPNRLTLAAGSVTGVQVV